MGLCSQTFRSKVMPPKSKRALHLQRARQARQTHQQQRQELEEADGDLFVPLRDVPRAQRISQQAQRNSGAPVCDDDETSEDDGDTSGDAERSKRPRVAAATRGAAEGHDDDDDDDDDDLLSGDDDSDQDGVRSVSTRAAAAPVLTPQAPTLRPDANAVVSAKRAAQARSRALRRAGHVDEAAQTSSSFELGGDNTHRRAAGAWRRVLRLIAFWPHAWTMQILNIMTVAAVCRQLMGLA
jgi:hypothetical protein